MAGLASPAPTAACVDDVEALAFVEGTLPPARRDEVLAHLDGCAACAALVAGLLDGVVAETRAEPAVPTEPPPQCGPYKIGALLAEGGMGRIYRALDTSLGRRVAIKVPTVRSPAMLRRFRREMEITARLQHPGVVPIHAAGELPDGTPYYVMPLVDGVTLDRALQDATGPEARLALVETLRAVAATMADVHQQGIVHRDLKPNNVLVGRRGEALIIDWGLAKIMPGSPAARRPVDAVTGRSTALSVDSQPPTSDELDTRAGDVLGTPAFMAPEQAAGRAVDARADVHACGAILACILTGRLAVATAAELSAASAPPALVKVCATAMAPDREDRYRDAGALHAALTAALTDTGRRRRRRWPAWAALAAVLVAGATALFLRGQGASAPAPRRLVMIEGEPAGTAAFALSRSGRRLAYATVDRVMVRDLTTGQVWTQTTRAPNGTGLQFDGDDALTYARVEESTRTTARTRWDLTTGRAIAIEPLRPIDMATWRGTFGDRELYVSGWAARPLELRGPGGVETIPTTGAVSVELVATAPGRRRLAFVDDGDRTRGVIRVVDLDGPPRASAPLADVTALTWRDDDTLLYATGSRGHAVLHRVTVTATDLGPPTVLFARDEAHGWFGGLAAAPGRLLVSLSTLRLATHDVDLASGSTMLVGRAVAAAPLAWRDGGRWLAWNRDSGQVEERSLDPAALATITVTATLDDPASATLADDLLIVAERTTGGRRVRALSLVDGHEAWTIAAGRFELVRCAGDRAAPCVAVEVVDGAMVVRDLDPRTGALGAELLRSRGIVDVALDATGHELAWIDESAHLWRRPRVGDAPPRALFSLGPTRTLAFDHRGELLSTRPTPSGRELVRVDERSYAVIARTGEPIVSLLRPSPDGAHLLYQARTFERALAELVPPP